MQAKDFDYLEGVHDYLQWLFSVAQAQFGEPERSGAQRGDITAFRSDPTLRDQLLGSFDVKTYSEPAGVVAAGWPTCRNSVKGAGFE